jgi:hypothetical protein
MVFVTTTSIEHQLPKAVHDMNITSNLKRTLCATLVAGTAVLAIGTTSVHAQDAGVSDNNRPRIEKACARIPNAQTRIDAAIARINGGADVRGSLLWLDTMIQKATAAGRTDLAAALTNRKAVREASLGVLELRKANLVEFKALCDKKLGS